MAVVIEKELRIEDPDFLAWLRRQPCAFCRAAGERQELRTEAHHTRPKGMGRAWVRDDLAVAACTACHMRCDGQTVDGRGPIPKDAQRAAAAAARDRYLAIRARDDGDSSPWW